MICCCFFLPTVLRSILQITLTTAFHPTLQLLLALRLLSQVLYWDSHSVMRLVLEGDSLLTLPSLVGGNSLPPEAQNITFPSKYKSRQTAV